MVLEIYAYEVFSFVGTFMKRQVREKMNVNHYDLNGRVIGVVENLRLCSGNAPKKKKCHQALKSHTFKKMPKLLSPYACVAKTSTVKHLGVKGPMGVLTNW